VHGRREKPLAGHALETIANPEASDSPESELLLADSVGLALLVVLDRLASAVRLAYVLHDMFDLPFK
jgi:RNA polymerase sigma-70 factor (ECF subfamily)